MLQIQEIVPYLRDNNHHDFGHIINQFRFGPDLELEAEARLLPREMAFRKKLGMKDPLQNVAVHTEESDYMFQYFLKVVSTRFVNLAGEAIDSHQYSVTQYERDLRQGNAPGRDGHAHMTSHGVSGVPGVFFNYEISPMKVIHTETRQSFAHFVTSSCAIIGGVLTVAGLIDSVIHNSSKRLKGGNDQYINGPSGKMVSSRMYG